MQNTRLERMQEVFKWFYPGLGIKRWLLVTMVGLIILSLGLFSIWCSVVEEYEILFLASLRKFSPSILGNITIILLGFSLLLWGLQQTSNAIAGVLLPHRGKHLVKELYLKRYLEKGPRIVALGGGTGLSILLRGLKEYTSNITAIVTVTDDGGSSGRLRSEMGMLPPGDLRNCLLSLADTEPLLERLFQHRFQGSKSLEGHNFGNLFIAALTEMVGFEHAIQEISNVLAIKGKVLPVTLQHVVLEAEFSDGSKAVGETNIIKKNRSIKKLSLLPSDCKPLPEVIAEIKKADAIVLGPGSLYTSVLPNLLVPGVKEAIKESGAFCFYVCNIMTQAGETSGYSASQHLRALERHGCGDMVDCIIVNTNTHLSMELAKKYQMEGSVPVKVDMEALSQLGIMVIKAHLLQQAPLVRHDGRKLATIIIETMIERETGLEGLWAYTHLSLNGRFRRNRKEMGGYSYNPFSKTQKKLERFLQKAITRI
ncbi:MAG: gluconeogenesis factor YvcK family protein [Dethiobacteria bacterium]|jgi:uncharacterized cofD-like protein